MIGNGNTNAKVAFNSIDIYVKFNSNSNVVHMSGCVFDVSVFIVLFVMQHVR